LIAITRVGAIGVDVEALTPFGDLAAVARRWFSPTEQAALSALPPDRRLAGFYRLWTRKEAVVKALGLGMTLPLDRFSVSAAPARLTDATDPRLRDLALLDIPLAGPYVAALAIRGRPDGPIAPEDLSSTGAVV
jgi:4'-phosphopantetheinyl transferase